MVRYTLFLLAFILLCMPVLAKKPLRLPESYDYYSAEDRYQWYQDARQYIVKHNGLNCVPPAKLVIEKDGTFKVIDIPEFYGGHGIKTSPELCLATVKSKKFPLPENSPMEKFILPIRPDGPLSRKELDALIFVKPNEEHSSKH